MSENQASYGFGDDTPKSGPSLNFGLNSGVSRMTMFQYNPNGGKDGAPQEILDIKFEANGKEINYRMFPVTRAFIKGGGETTDPTHEAFKTAMQEFNGNVVHILKAFVPVEQIKAALSIPISGFAQFCNVCVNLLPVDYNKKRLDLFGQYQWAISGENTRTFINLPKNVKHGRWICASVQPEGAWTESRINGGLAYVDAGGKNHPFTRNKWYMDSNFAKLQKEDSMDDVPIGGDIPTGDMAVVPNTTTDWT
jgi:hypothetical protein